MILLFGVVIVGVNVDGDVNVSNFIHVYVVVY